MNLTMNPSTGMPLTKTKFVHVVYTYFKFGFTILKLFALFDHINLTTTSKISWTPLYLENGLHLARVNILSSVTLSSLHGVTI